MTEAKKPGRPKKEPEAFTCPTWRYSDEFPEGKLFAEGDEVPTAKGWVDTPAKLKAQ